MVEAPGTAPGSEWLITESIYRRSRTNPAPLTYGVPQQKKRPLNITSVVIPPSHPIQMSTVS